jgi:hypothetical protein
MPQEPKPDKVKIIQITAGTPTETPYHDPYKGLTTDGSPVEVYGLGDDGELYWRNDHRWWRA